MIRLRSLGECILDVGESRLRPSAQRLFGLALYLSLASDRPILRTKLQRLFWHDSEDSEAQHCLRQAIYRLNRMGAGLQCEKSSILLPSRETDSDLGQLLACRAADELERFARRIRGPFLPDYTPHLSEEFSVWLESQRDIATVAISRALIAGIAASRARGDWREVETLSTTCLSIDPLNEQATLAAADSVALQGNKRQALRLLDRYVKEVGPSSAALGPHVLRARRRIAATDSLATGSTKVARIPLVNRDHEIAALTRSLSAARDGRGSVLFLAGRMGIGKTRLLHESVRLAAITDFQIAGCCAQKHDTRRPLSSFADLTSILLGLRGAAGCSPRSVSFLKRLTTVTSNENQRTTEATDIELVRAHIRTGLFDLLDAIAEETPLLLVIDNAQWADDLSWEIIGELVRWTSERRILLLASVRDPKSIGRGGEDADRAASCIRLEPLSSISSAELVRRILLSGGAAIDQALIESSAAVAGGNPLQLIELALHGIAEGTNEVPARTASRLLGQRLSQLQPLTLRTLQTCALLGNMCTLERLERVLGERRINLIEALDELDRSSLVTRDGDLLRCAHETVARAATATMTSLALAVVHRHVAEALEATVDATQSGLAQWEAARHWAEAGHRDRALHLLRACARHCVEMGAPDEAARLLASADAWTSTSAEAIALHEERLRALQLADSWDDIPDVLTQLRQLRHSVGAPEERHSAQEILLLESRWRTGAPQRELYVKACDCAVAEDASPAHRLQAATLALVLADNLATTDRVAEVYDSMSCALRSGSPDESAALHIEMVYHTCFGQPRLAATAADSIIEIARRTGTAAALSRVLRHASIALLVGRSWQAAENTAREAFEVASALRLSNAALAAAARMTELYLRRECYDDACQWYAECSRHQDRLRGVALLTIYLSHGVQIALHAREARRAEALLSELRQRVNRLGSPRAHAEVRALEVEIKLLRGESAKVRDVQQLLRLHQLLRTFASHDAVVQTLVRALESRGAATRASEILGVYAKVHRRELSQLPPALTARLQANGSFARELVPVLPTASRGYAD